LNLNYTSLHVHTQALDLSTDLIAETVRSQLSRPQRKTSVQRRQRLNESPETHPANNGCM